MLLQFLQHLAKVLSPVFLSRPQLILNSLAEIIGLGLQLFADAINVVQLQQEVQVNQHEHRHTQMSSSFSPPSFHGSMYIHAAQDNISFSDTALNMIYYFLKVTGE